MNVSFFILLIVAGKLEKCRLLRKDLIQADAKAKTATLKENSPPLLTAENKKRCISRKEILDKENKARASVQKGKVPPPPLFLFIILCPHLLTLHHILCLRLRFY